MDGPRSQAAAVVEDPSFDLPLEPPESVPVLSRGQSRSSLVPSLESPPVRRDDPWVLPSSPSVAADDSVEVASEAAKACPAPTTPTAMQLAVRIPTRVLRACDAMFRSPPLLGRSQAHVISRTLGWAENRRRAPC